MDEGAGSMDEEGAASSSISQTAMNPPTPVNIDIFAKNYSFREFNLLALTLANKLSEIKVFSFPYTLDIKIT
jgi:hypothetical protein